MSSDQNNILNAANQIMQPTIRCAAHVPVPRLSHLLGLRFHHPRPSAHPPSTPRWYRYRSLAPTATLAAHPPPKCLSTDHHSSVPAIVSTPEKPFPSILFPKSPTITVLDEPRLLPTVIRQSGPPTIGQTSRPRGTSLSDFVRTISPRPAVSPPNHTKACKGKDATLFTSCIFHYYSWLHFCCAWQWSRHDVSTTCNLGQWQRQSIVTAIPTPDAVTSSFPRHYSPQPPTPVCCLRMAVCTPLHRRGCLRPRLRHCTAFVLLDFSTLNCFLVI